MSRLDSAFTHCREEVQVAIAAYNITIAHLIASGGADIEGALAKAKSFIESSGNADVLSWFE